MCFNAKISLVLSVLYIISVIFKYLCISVGIYFCCKYTCTVNTCIKTCTSKYSIAVRPTRVPESAEGYHIYMDVYMCTYY